MTLVEFRHDERCLCHRCVTGRLNDPSKARPDYGIDLKRPKDWTPPHLIEVISEPEAPPEIIEPGTEHLQSDTRDVLRHVAKRL